MEEGGKEISRRELLGAASAGVIGVAQVELLRAQRLKGSVWEQRVRELQAAAARAINRWRTEARIVGIVINGPIATGGRIEGPSVEAFLRAEIGPSIPESIRVPICRVLGGAWTEWAVNARVPGLPWYPAFAAFPGPQAPPMPNIPTPVCTLVSPGLTAVTAGLFDRLRTELGGILKEEGAESALREFAAWFSASFVNWSMAQQVMLVMGKGPIPTFAPPYVPVGPVVMGDNIPTPNFTTYSFGLPTPYRYEPAERAEAVSIGDFDLQLADGAVARAPGEMILYGDIRFTPRGGGIELLLRGGSVQLSSRTTADSATAAEIQRRLAAASEAAAKDGQITHQERDALQQASRSLGLLEQQLAAPARTATPRDTGGAQPWNALRAHGRLEVSAGANTLTVPGARLLSKPDGALELLGGQVTINGIRHTAGTGSLIRSSEILLAGHLALQNHFVKDSRIAIRPSGISGSGRLEAFAHSFLLTYQFGDGSVRASAEAGGPERGWLSAPRVESALIRLVSPRIRVEMNGPALSARLVAGRIEARTRAVRPDGKPWAERAASLREAAIAPNGDVTIALPPLPQPEDPNAEARAACESAARAANRLPPLPEGPDNPAKRAALKAYQEAKSRLDAALEECRRKHPLPPRIAPLPPQVTVKVGSLVG